MNALVLGAGTFKSMILYAVYQHLHARQLYFMLSIFISTKQTEGKIHTHKNHKISFLCMFPWSNYFELAHIQEFILHEDKHQQHQVAPQQTVETVEE